jgi:hypothetical protein
MAPPGFRRRGAERCGARRAWHGLARCRRAFGARRRGRHGHACRLLAPGTCAASLLLSVLVLPSLLCALAMALLLVEVCHAVAAALLRLVRCVCVCCAAAALMLMLLCCSCGSLLSGLGHGPSCATVAMRMLL